MARLHLTFPEHLIDEPVIWRFGQELGLPFNIARANVDATAAWVILEVEADARQASEAADWFSQRGIQVGRLPDEEAP
jgi:L-aspartate semialdehyde sulfurtransferase ferredoxin